MRIIRAAHILSDRRPILYAQISLSLIISILIAGKTFDVSHSPKVLGIKYRACSIVISDKIKPKSMQYNNFFLKIKSVFSIAIYKKMIYL